MTTNINNTTESSIINAKDKYQIAIGLILYKLIFFILAILASKYGKMLIEDYYLPIDTRSKVFVVSEIEKRFCTFDAIHYLEIAQYGYIPNDGICAFYPLFPGLIWLVSKITGLRYFLSGMILSNLFSLLAFYQFYLLVYERYGKKAAIWSLIFLLVFPGAIFFQLIYTESMFLFLATTFFRCLFKNNLTLAGIAAFLMPMTRAVGIFVLLPLTLWLWTQRRPIREYAVILLPMFGYVSYFCIMAYYTGNPFEGFIAQNDYPNQPSIMNILNLNKFIISIFNVNSFHDTIYSALDRFHFLIMIEALYLVWFLDKRFFEYSVLVGVIPAMSHYFWSYPRMFMMAFPVFIAFGVNFNKPGQKWIHWYILIIMGSLNLYFILLYFNNHWTS
jgi:hypothetical protein